MINVARPDNQAATEEMFRKVRVPGQNSIGLFFPLIVKKDLSVKDNAVKKLYSSYFVIFCDATNLNKSHQTKYATNRQQLTKAVSNVNVIFDRHISTKFQNIEYNLEADIVKITRLHQKLHGGWSKFLEVGCGWSLCIVQAMFNNQCLLNSIFKRRSDRVDRSRWQREGAVTNGRRRPPTIPAGNTTQTVTNGRRRHGWRSQHNAYSYCLLLLACLPCHNCNPMARARHCVFPPPGTMEHDQ